MRFRRRKLATALLWTTGVGGALTGAPMAVHATDVTVEVTGSNIKGVLSEGALPVQTITREEIAKSGAQTAYEILDRVSAVIAYGGFNETFSIQNSNASGFAGVSLRGIGFDKTLILINGRRLANYALGRVLSGVDLNAIPTAVIDRVEILKDGASAIYGTDAIGGVINFITRKDFSGAEIYGYYASPQEKGGAQRRATLTGGYGNLSADKFNAWLSFDYLDSEAVTAASRSFAKTRILPGIGVDATSFISFPANVAIPGTGPRNPTDPTPNAPDTVLSPVCLRPASFPTVSSPHQCQYDPATRYDIVNPATRYNVSGRLAWQINPDLQMFGEGSYARNQFTFHMSETLADRLMLPASSPYFPEAWLQANYPAMVGQPLSVSWRTVDLGRRTQETTSEQERGVLGVNGSIRGWDYEAALNYNRSKVSNSFTEGYLDQRIFYPLFQTGAINPFGPNTREALAQMDSAIVNEVIQQATGTINSIDAKASGDIAVLPAGPLALALGGEYRKEELSQWRAPIFESGNIVGGPGAISTMQPADRTVGSLFAEAYVPIVRNLDAQVAVRLDKYSDFGSTTNSKVALRWQPAKQILFRGSWNTGFHAPSLIELYQPLYRTVASGFTRDELRCPVTLLPDDCNRQFEILRGGNPALLPERSEQWSLGIVLEPVEGLSMSVDGFRIELQDVLGQRSLDFISRTLGDPNSPYVQRGPVEPAYPTLPGPISYWIGPTQNLGRKLVEGIDVDLTARSATSSLGKLIARLNGTYLTTYRQSREDGTFPNIVGTRGDIGSIPRWKHVLTFDWAYGPWSATLIENYTHSYSEACIRPSGLNPGDVSGCTTRKVAAYDTWDLSGGYSGFRNTTLRLGIRNLANRDPPLSNQSTAIQTGYDPSYADPRGRTFYGSVRYVFR